MNSESKEYAKKLISSSISDALDYLSEVLNSDSASYNDLIVHKKRFTVCRENFYGGIINYEDYTISTNRISVGLLNLIDNSFSIEKNKEAVIHKVTERNKKKRNERLVNCQILRIDDKKKNLKQRSFSNTMFQLIPSTLFFIGMLILLVMHLSLQESISNSAILLIIYFAIFISYFCFQIYSSIKVYYANSKNLPRKIEQLEIDVVGDYRIIFDGIFRSLKEISAKVTDYNISEGLIEADYKKVIMLERVFSSPSCLIKGERLKITVKNKDSISNIKIISTAKSTEQSAHEGDFFSVQKRINIKNLRKIQETLIENLVD